MNEDLVREIGRVVFTPVRLREGYDMGAVDHFLDWLVGVVDARVGDPGSPSTDSAAQGSAGRPEAPPTAPAAPTVAAQVSSVIKEQPGLWARIFRRNG